MDFKEYQEKAQDTALYPSIQERYVYPTLGLVGEAGEIANKVKKIFRDDDGILSDDRRVELQKELGDVLWYISQIATELELKLDDIAKDNIGHLLSRKERGALHGSGDNR